MARILVQHDTEPLVFIEITVNDYDANADGRCPVPLCGFTISEGGTRFTELVDAIIEAIVHLDHKH